MGPRWARPGIELVPAEPAVGGNEVDQNEERGWNEAGSTLVPPSFHQTCPGHVWWIHLDPPLYEIYHLCTSFTASLALLIFLLFALFSAMFCCFNALRVHDTPRLGRKEVERDGKIAESTLGWIELEVDQKSLIREIELNLVQYPSFLASFHQI